MNVQTRQAPRAAATPARQSFSLRARLAWGMVAVMGFGVAAHAQAPAAGPAEAPRFDIFQYAVSGNSLLSDAGIEKAVSTHMGPGRSLKDVEAARAALEKAYHDLGYLTVVVSIPAQSVDEGEVALQVVEATVDRLRVKGAEFTLPSGIKEKVPELAEGKVPNFKAMQDQLAALNRGADSRVTPVLRAGALPGTVEVQLDVDDQLPLHGSVEISNRQTPNTTALRTSASIRYDNLWQRGHSLGLTLQASPQRTSDARVAALSYVVPYGSDGHAVSLFLVDSRSDFASLSNAPGLGLLGNSDVMGLRHTWRLSASAESSHTLTAGLDYRDIRQSLRVGAGAVTEQPISYTPLIASYTGALFDASRSSTLEVSAAVGLRGLLGNSEEKFQAKRSGASASFIALRTGLQHTEMLDRWSLLGKLEFQLASGPLVPNDQFTAGGAESVRGYLEGERAGDGGLRVSVELRTPAWSPAGTTSAWRVGGLAFVDAAQLRTLKVVAPQPASTRLVGVGLGLRLTAPLGLTLELDAARALVQGDLTASGSNRVHARGVWAY